MDALKAREKLAAAKETNATGTSNVADKVSGIPRCPIKCRVTRGGSAAFWSNRFWWGLACEKRRL